MRTLLVFDAAGLGLPARRCRARACGPGRAVAAADRPPRPRSKPKKKRPAKPRAQVISARIVDVIDGDTIKVRAYGAKRNHYDVRLIGIDTPETHKPGVAVECGGPEATSRMFELAFTAQRDTDGDGLYDAKGGTGASVELRTDPTQDLFDRYDRLLAYVSEAGALLQTRMLSSGWAATYVYGGKPFQKVTRFRAAERGARTSDRGVYGKCGSDFHSEQ
jgi:micrococcal nuclease